MPRLRKGMKNHSISYSRTPWTKADSRIVSMILAPVLSLFLVIAAVRMNLDFRVEIFYGLLYLALLIDCFGIVSGIWLLFGRWSTFGIRGLAFSFILIDAVALHLVVFFLRR